MSSIVDALLAARDLISEEDHWTTETYHNEDDTRHCAIGALVHVAGLCKSGTYMKITKLSPLRYLDQAAFVYAKEHDCSPATLVHINDAFGHSAVMETYDIAIRLAKDAGKE